MALPTRLTRTWLHPSRIAEPGVGHAGLDVVGELEPLLVAQRGERLHDVAHHLAQAERDALELQPVGLDAREVEDVVEQPQQRLRRGAGDADELTLLGAELGLDHQVQHADDTVHRRADLMAHAGQEVALAEARRLRRLLREPQLPLAGAQLGIDPLALGDVAQHHDPAEQRAVRVPQRPAGDAHGHPFGDPGVAQELLDVGRLLAARRQRERQLVGGEGRNGVGEEDAVGRRPVLRAARRGADADDALGGAVEDQELPVPVADHQPLSHAVEHRFEERGLPAQRVLRLTQALDLGAPAQHGAQRGAGEDGDEKPRGQNHPRGSGRLRHEEGAGERGEEEGDADAGDQQQGDRQVPAEAGRLGHRVAA